MKSFITTALLIFSFSSFAGNMEFSTLDCSVKHSYLTPAQKMFKLTLKFKSIVSADNNSGLDKTQIADLSITHSMGEGKTRTIILKDISLMQYTSAYGYQLSFQEKIFGSDYDSFLNLSPSFKGIVSKSVSFYKGNIQLNASVNDNDAMVMTTENLFCVPQL